MGKRIEGRDWLLLLIAAGDGQKSIDPVRVMKGAFILTKELAARGESEPYEFIPYHYGPCAPDVYGDLDSLAAEGLIVVDATPPRKWPVYRATMSGTQRAKAVAEELDEIWTDYIPRLRAWLDRQTFDSLLRTVYKLYPEYASKTLLPDLAKQL